MKRAICFDFNGTLSLDEELMYELVNEVLTEHGRPLPREQYFGPFIGLADDEIAARWLGADRAAAAAIARERSRRYAALPLDGRVRPAAADAVRAAADHAPIALVTSSLRFEVEPVLAHAGLAGAFDVVVAGDDVERPKPDPQPYALALQRLGADGGVAFEDTPAGVASAAGAELACCGIVGTVGPSRLLAAGAIRVADELTTSLVLDFFEGDG